MDRIVEQIKEKPLERVYVVHGPDGHRQKNILAALQARALQGSFSDWNWVLIAGSKDLTAGQIIEELSTTPWDGGEKVVAVTYGEQVPAAIWDSLVKWLGEHSYANSLALFFDKLDKRLKGTKSLIKLGVEVDCPNLTGQTLIRWVQDYVRMQDHRIKQDALILFLERVGDDLSIIVNELEKLFLYVGDKQDIELEHVEEVTTLVPGQLEKGAIFQMVDAIAAKKQDEAVDVLHRLVDAGEAPLRILPLIERQLRLLLAAKTKGSISLAEVAKQMGENTDFPLRKASRYHQKFTEEQLYAGFSYVIEADRDLKLGGDGEYVLEQLLLRICC